LSRICKRASCRLQIFVEAAELDAVAATIEPGLPAEYIALPRPTAR
jgi:hypothetical protein